MGKATKRKQEEFQARQPDFNGLFLKSKEAAEKKQADIESFDPMIAIKGYEQYAIKPLDRFFPRTRSLNTSTRVRELVRYAFNKYNPPGFLYQVWDPDFNRDLIRVFPNIKEDFRLWFLALVQGKSLYKEYAMGLLTKKEVHHFSTCPYTFNISEAIWYSIIRGLDEKASPSVARKIAGTKLSNELATDFWKSVAQWFMAHPTSVKNMNDLLDYIRNRHQANAEWHLRDMTLHNLERHMYNWHREMYRVRSMSIKYEKWEGIKLEDSVIERAQGTNKHTWWKFHQIKTGKELAEEGNRQHHCVSSYGSMCSSGQCSIWSLTFKDKVGNQERALTIELRGGQIVQARGYANRLPKKDELSVLNEWAARCNFRVKST